MKIPTRNSTSIHVGLILFVLGLFLFGFPVYVIGDANQKGNTLAVLYGYFGFVIISLMWMLGVWILFHRTKITQSYKQKCPICKQNHTDTEECFSR